MSLLQRSTTRLIARTSSTYTRSFTTSSRILSSDNNPKISANYSKPPVPKSRANPGTKLPVFPIVFIFAAGSASFYFLAKSRDGQGSSHYVLPAKATRDDIYSTPHQKKD